MRNPHTDIQDALLTFARELWAKDRYLQPVAFLILPLQILIVPLVGDPTEQKEILQAHIVKHNPMAVITQAEAWVVQGAAAPTALAARLAGLPSIEEYPGRTEAIISTLRIRDGSVRCLLIDILEDRTLAQEVQVIEDLNPHAAEAW